MKKIFALLFLVVASSCVNSLEEPCTIPIVGTWAKVNQDGSVSEYVKFDSGKYSTYITTKKLYYLDGKIWNSSESSYTPINSFGYSAYGDQLHYANMSMTLSMSNGVLKIGQSEYYPLNAWKSHYGFTLTHDIPLSNSIATYSAASQDIVWNYEIKNLPKGYIIGVQEDAEWVRATTNGNQVKLHIDENPTLNERSAKLKLSHPAVAPLTVNLTQMMSGPMMSSSSTSCDYVGGQKEFGYAITNPREGLSVEVSCNADWITNLVISGSKVSFKVAENNDGSSRIADIVLKYGSVAVTYRVTQMGTPLDLSSTGTANSYIVSKLGAYKIKTVKGNSSSSVGTVSKADVLWESFGTSTAPSVGDLIQYISYQDGYITILTGDTFKEGNAVIAAKDASGEILWSWHIWFTDAPQGQVYYNNAGTMMDRNLGATSATPGDVGALGLLYQWGRKDPFLGSSSISSGTDAKSTITWPSFVSSTSSTGTIDYATKNPTTFISGFLSTSCDWHYSSRDNTLWTTSDKAKSIYDPCPPGWRVPDGGSSGVWSKAVRSSSRFNYTYNSSNEGMNFSGKFGSASTIWYPASGCWYYFTGGLHDVGTYGYYWSASPLSDDAYTLNFNGSGHVIPSDNDYRAYGHSVRCIQE